MCLFEYLGHLFSDAEKAMGLTPAKVESNAAETNRLSTGHSGGLNHISARKNIVCISEYHEIPTTHRTYDYYQIFLLR